MQELGAADRAAAEVARLAAEAAARAAAEEEAVNNIVVHESPLIPRPYTSSSAAETEDFIASLSTTAPTRPPICVRVQRRLRSFGAPLVLDSRDTAALLCDVRPRKDLTHETKRRRLETGVQAGSSTSAALRSDASAQTAFNPRRDVSIAVDFDVDVAVADVAAARAVGAGLAFQIDEGLAAARAAAARAALSCAPCALPLPALLSEPPCPVDARDVRAMIDDVVLLAAALEGEPTPEAPSKAALAAEAAAARAAAAEQKEGGAEGGAGGAGGGATGAAPQKNAGSGHSRNKAAAAAAGEPLVDFLKRVLPSIEHALSQNETLDIFNMSLALESGGGGGGAGDDADGTAAAAAAGAEASGGGAASGGLVPREEKRFSDMDFSNGASVVDIAWHPDAPNWVAFGVLPSMDFATRVQTGMLPRWSHVLLFTLGEFTASVALCVPGAVCGVAWCPSNAALIAVSMRSGQIVIFDITTAAATLRSKRKLVLLDGGPRRSARVLIVDAPVIGLPPSLVTSVPHAAEKVEDERGGIFAGGARAGAGGAAEGGADADDQRALKVRPRAISSADVSHGKTITSMRWLPPSGALTSRHRLVTEPAADALQLMTTSLDGNVCVWDVAGAMAYRGAHAKVIPGAPAGEAPPVELLQSTLVPGAMAAVRKISPSPPRATTVFAFHSRAL